MCRFISALLIVLVFGKFSPSAGYKWISLDPSDPIPSETIVISTRTVAYVGRARHYDEVLPAAVYNSTHAGIISCGQEIIKHQFEILVHTEPCQWKEFNQIQDVPENIVLAGNAWDGEPVYVARASDNEYSYRIASVFLRSNQVRKWPNSHGTPQALLCDRSKNWVDTSAATLPNNTIPGGQSEDGLDIFVARLKRNCNIIPGQVTPVLGFASALFEENYINSSYCQVLVGDLNEYSWVTAFNGEIPDHSVPAGKKYRELMYVAKFNKTIGYIVHGEALNSQMEYEILTHSSE